MVFRELLMVIDVGGGGQYGHQFESTYSGDVNPTMRLGRIQTLWQLCCVTYEHVVLAECA